MKQLFTLFFIIIGLSAFNQGVTYVDVTETSVTKPVEETISTLADSLINAAFVYKGVNYKYGGMGFDGMDCSGFICRTFGDINIKVPHSSTSLSLLGEYVDADLLQHGDLLFFKGRTANSVGHVAMVSKVENGNIYMIHSSTSRGVIEEILQKSEYFMSRWLFNKRISKD